MEEVAQRWSASAAATTSEGCTSGAEKQRGLNEPREEREDGSECREGEGEWKEEREGGEEVEGAQSSCEWERRGEGSAALQPSGEDPSASERRKGDEASAELCARSGCGRRRWCRNSAGDVGQLPDEGVRGRDSSNRATEQGERKRDNAAASDAAPLTPLRAEAEEEGDGRGRSGGCGCLLPPAPLPCSGGGRWLFPVSFLPCGAAVRGCGVDGG